MTSYYSDLKRHTLVGTENLLYNVFQPIPMPTSLSFTKNQLRAIRL